MPEFKRIYLLAFFLGLFVYALQYTSPDTFFNSQFKESSNKADEAASKARAENPMIVKGLQLTHEKIVEKTEEKERQQNRNVVASRDIAESAQKLYSERALSSRDEWDKTKSKNPEIILYFMDRYPREIAEEIINAFR